MGREWEEEDYKRKKWVRRVLKILDYWVADSMLDIRVRTFHTMGKDKGAFHRLVQCTASNLRAHVADF